jgi:TolB-like protein/AraC-like DNA-binding protein
MTEPLSMNQAFIKKLSDIVLKNISDENFGAEKLAEKAGMSHASLHRKVKAITHRDISQFIREVRLKLAMEMLQKNEGNVVEIAFRVGFGSATYFSRCFHEYFGYPPGEVRKRESAVANPINDEEIPKHPSVSTENKQKEQFVSPGKILNSGNKIIIISGILSAVLLLFVLYFFLVQRSATGKRNEIQEKSIVVLPFRNLSNDMENQYFADGIMEDILNCLFRVGEIKVVSRTTAEHFRENPMTSPEIAKMLKVNYVLEGSVFRAENKIRIFVQLIDARNDQHILSEKYEGEMSDIFDLQSDIAQKVATVLETVLTREEIGQIKKMPTNSPDAYNSYLKARFLFNKANDVQRVDISPEGLKSSIQYYEKAIMEDSTFALAYAGLANAWYNLCAWGWYQPYYEGIGKARDLSNKALEINPDCSEAHTVKGACFFYPDRKFKDAERELLISLRLNPNYACAHQAYAQLLMITGPIEKSREHMDRVLELEPYFWVAHNLNSWICYFERKNREGIEACTTGRDLNPYSLDNDWLFIIHYAKLGEAEKAAKELRDIFSRYLKTNKYDNEITDAFNRSGIKGLFEWLIDLNINRPVGLEGMSGQPFYVAWWYAILGRKEQAIYWLEKVNKSQYIPYHYFDLITTNPDFDFIRDDPRFIKILDEYGLKPYNGINVR